jgi:hypothetical protein
MGRAATCTPLTSGDPRRGETAWRVSFPEAGVASAALLRCRCASLDRGRRAASAGRLEVATTAAAAVDCAISPGLGGQRGGLVSLSGSVKGVSVSLQGACGTQLLACAIGRRRWQDDGTVQLYRYELSAGM